MAGCAPSFRQDSCPPCVWNIWSTYRCHWVLIYLRNARFGGLPVCYGWHGPEGAPRGLPWVTLAWGFGGLPVRYRWHGPEGAPRGLPWVTLQDHCEKSLVNPLGDKPQMAAQHVATLGACALGGNCITWACSLCVVSAVMPLRDGAIASSKRFTASRRQLPTPIKTRSTRASKT